MIVKSMTGFGKATADVNGKKLVVEVKSLNAKQFDMSLKLPHTYSEMELEIRNRAKAVLERGKIDIFIYFDASTQPKSATINETVVTEYVTEMKSLIEKLNLTVDDASILKSVMRLPDTMQTEKNEVGEEELSILMNCVDEALKMADEYRIKEGEVLIADILHRVDLIEEYSAELAKFEVQRIPLIRQRIEERMKELTLPEALDKNRLEQELIYYIEKLDITEEKVRLANHCAYFRETVAKEPSPGRKLGFIAQEMGREINTTGSKSNDADMQQFVVRMKDELEKIKEQSLNLL